ncbi:hypothetical protein [Streptomyces sp. ADI92-24]|nr:hypothetical protein [Streptomyces sp. ADI92-24]
MDTADSHGIERMTARGVVVGGVEFELDCLDRGAGLSSEVSGGS